MNKKFTALIVVILLVVAVYLVVSATNNKAEPNLTELETKNNQCTGYIEGSFYGWSEVLPEGLHVCAQDMNTQYYYCTDKSIIDDERFKFGKGYELELPEGLYRVAGLHPSELINPEQAKEFKSISDACNANDEKCLISLQTIKVSCNEVSVADLNSRGELDLFERFDLRQYPNYLIAN